MSERFLGSVIRLSFQRGTGFNRLLLTPKETKLLTLTKRRLVPRASVKCVKVVKRRLLPFWWSTEFHFALESGDDFEVHFVPYRAGRLRAAFIANGWPLCEPG